MARRIDPGPTDTEAARARDTLGPMAVAAAVIVTAGIVLSVIAGLLMAAVLGGLVL